MTPRCLPALVAVLLCGGMLVPAASAEIVYREPDGGLGAMGDDGGVQQTLLEPSQGGFQYSSDTSVDPAGSAVAFSSGEAGQASCTDTINCVGIYVFADGAVRRLSGAPAHCPSASNCTTFDDDPSVASNGGVYYEFDLSSGDLECGLGGCINWQSGGPGLYVRDVAGAEQPTAVAFPSGATANVQDGVANNANLLVFAADPQAPASIAYQGVYVDDCIDGDQNCYPVDVESTSDPDGTARVIGDAVGDSARLAWSPDASLIADLVTSTSTPGIWVFATQGPASTGSLVVAGTGSGRWPGEYGLTFAGDGALVVEYDDNLYSLPSRCWATATTIAANGTATPNCTIATDGTPLTSGGTTQAPFRFPAWTAATVAPFATSSPGPGSGPAPGSGSGTTTTTTTPTTTTPTTTTAGRPALSHGSLSGVATRRARLSFTISAGAHAPALRSFVVGLALGISFARTHKLLSKGIVVSSAAGRKLKLTAKIAHGTLTVALKSVAAKVKVTIAYPAVAVGKALAGKVKRRKVKTLAFAIRATNAHHHTTRLTLRLKPR